MCPKEQKWQKRNKNRHYSLQSRTECLKIVIQTNVLNVNNRVPKYAAEARGARNSARDRT